MANASNSTMNIPNTFNLTGTWQNNIDPLTSRNNTQQTTNIQQQTRRTNTGGNGSMPLNSNIQPSNTTNDNNNIGINTNESDFQSQIPANNGQVLNQNMGVQNTATTPRVNGSGTIILNPSQNNNNIPNNSQNSQNYQTLSNFVSTQIGRNATVEFLLGENSLIEKTGTIAAVGENYILLNDSSTRSLIACDLKNIKFIYFEY